MTFNKNDLTAIDAPGVTTARAASPVSIETLLDADSPRQNGINESHVRLLAESIDKLPPIIVHIPTMRVVDGMHRLYAARLRGRTTIEVVYFDGSEMEAFLLAVELNIKHGLPLSLQERKESAKRILCSFSEWSDRAIAAKVGLSNKTVGAVRRSFLGSVAQPAVRVGLDGRARPLSSVQGRLRASEILAHNPDTSLREIARSAGISAETARDVRERVGKGDSPLPVPDSSSDSRPRSGANGQRKNPWQTDLAVMLNSLKRDPAVKYSSEGRALVRWLEVRLVCKDDTDLMMRTPAHQATKVATMARVFAARWDEIAAQLEQQGLSEENPGQDGAGPAGSPGDTTGT